MIELKYKDVPEIRKKLLKEQNGVCPICKKVITDPVLDHDHQRKTNGTGMCRGVVCRNCNSFLGRVENSCQRYGIKNKDLILILKNIIRYLKSPQTDYLHPTEKNVRIKNEDWLDIEKYYFKVYPRKRVLPKWPENGFINKNLKKILKDIKKYIKDEQKPKRKSGRTNKNTVKGRNRKK